MSTEATGPPDINNDPAVSRLVQPIADANVEVGGHPNGAAEATLSQGNNKEDSNEEEHLLPGFSANASKTFFTYHGKYLVDLERMSRFKAKQGSAEVVSTQHVKEAAAFLSYLSSPRDKKTARYCETFGGLLLGAGISEALTLLQSAKYSGWLLSTTLALVLVGAALIGVFLGRD